jgi:peptidoglycan/LPS O-acetylase OafA/YrhL
MAYQITFSYINHDVYAILFLVLILNVASNPKSLLSFENKLMSELGKISYGLYLYHPFIFFLLIYFIHQGWFSSSSSFLNLVIYYIIEIGGTILVSWISYTYYEKYFLSKKKKFTLIKSGDDVKE